MQNPDASLDETLERAFGLHQAGRTEQAMALYRHVLAHAPEHPAALHFLGLLLHGQGDAAEAAKLLERARESAPDYLDAHNNLGNIYLELERFDQAESCFRRVLELDDRFAATHFNLGMLLFRAQRYGEAEAELAKAASLEPGDPLVYARLGDARAKQGKFAEARAALRTSLALDPGAAEERRKLGVVYEKLIDELDRGLGDPEAALGYLDEWLELEPENPIAKHSRAAYAGDEAPERASDGYVKATYDQFAESFDHVLGSLGYRGHELCAAALQAGGPRAGGADQALDVLDAGCGTGAFGPLAKPWARRLVGVDLSPKMLAKASERRVYDELCEEELTAFLERSTARFDVVVCADALIYFGDLRPVFGAVGRALRRSGRFVFTIEALADESATFHLHRHGRYSHSERYVREVLAEAGLSVTARQPIVCLRVEFGAEVPGVLFLSEKAAHG